MRVSRGRTECGRPLRINSHGHIFNAAVQVAAGRVRQDAPTPPLVGVGSVHRVRLSGFSCLKGFSQRIVK